MTGIIVQENDGSPPSLGLQIDVDLAGDERGQSATVSVGGERAVIGAPVANTRLAVRVSAGDPESGVRDMELWVRRSSSILGDENVTTATIRETHRSEAAPGAEVSETMIFLDSIPVEEAIGPQRALRTDFWTVVVNHRGLQASTPPIVVLRRSP